jgi:ParB family chromosome partitioning protein
MKTPKEPTQSAQSDNVAKPLVLVIALHLIDEPAQFQLRFRPYDDIPSLVDSIRELGQLNPLFVRPVDGGRFELIAGHRRLAALKLLGWRTAHCRIYDGISDDAAYDLAVSENCMRFDLTELEVARAEAKLKELLR